jgi:hypothetical protein
VEGAAPPLYRVVLGIGDVDVSAAVHRHAGGLAKAAARAGLRRRGEGDRRPDARAVNVGVGQNVAASVDKLDAGPCPGQGRVA